MLTRYRVYTIFTAVLIVIFMAFNFSLAMPYYQMQNVIMVNQLSSTQSLNAHAMHAKMKNGEAFFIAGDIGHDKAELSLLIRELTQLGYGVLIYDLPSEGFSDGVIPVGYKSDSEFLAHHFYNTYVAYTQLENISVNNIHIVGFGESARAILQTGSLGLFAEQQGNAHAIPLDITLVGADFNLSGKADFDVLNYRKDNEIEWISRLGPNNPGIPINIIASNIDRSATVKDSELLLEKFLEGLASGAEPKSRLSIIKYVPHGSLMGSVKVLEAIIQMTVNEAYKAPGLLYLRDPISYATLALFALLCYLAGRLVYRQSYTGPLPERKRATGLFRVKVAMNLFGLILDILLLGAFYAAPVPFPYYDILPILTLAGFGFVMLFLYRFTTFANNLGSSVILRDANASPIAGIVTLGGAVALCTLMLASFPRNPFSLMGKPVWIGMLMLLFLPLLYIDEKERRLFADDRKLCFMLFAANFLALLISPLATAAIGLTDASFTMLRLIACFLAAISTEFFCRPLGLSSFSTSLTKAAVLIMLAFTDLTLFY
ncbi:MAG: hypothetical protein FWG30_02775 [Eubacteriaceae bacterium]|nr:hypothetical protein [Eubacteriaceae bacterium]